MKLKLESLLAILFSFPVAYCLISYLYLAAWHRSFWLWDKVVHENGRLTLLGTIFYFDHFLGCVPMVVLFALCTAGGFALANDPSRSADPLRARAMATKLLVGCAAFILLAFILSLATVGWQRTLDYALQRIERDGVLSAGGNWNQLQLSNIPIALGVLALCIAVRCEQGSHSKRRDGSVAWAVAAVGLATVLCVGITALNWCGWRGFLNPRWLAHGLREVSTYPLTGIPIALAGVVLVETHLCGTSKLRVRPNLQGLVLLGIGFAIVFAQLLVLRSADVLSLAQRPSFAPNGLSISYLLFSHVFEHFLDFVLIGPLAGGLYATVTFLTSRAVQGQ